jgi:hypothetical protein
MPGATQGSYNLLLSEDRLSSQYAQSPATARRLLNWIPSRAGDLKRKPYAPPFVAGNAPDIGGQPAWFSGVRDYLFYSAGGALDRQIIVKVSNNLSTYLYKYDSGTLAPLPAGAFDPPHNAGNGWIGDPVILDGDGIIIISDGTGNSTVYDGTRTWKLGFDIPAAAPAIDSSSTPGSIDFVGSFAEYVVTELDDGSVSGRIHESPPSARVRFTAPTVDTYDVTINMPGAVTNVAPGTASDWTAGYPTHRRIYRSSVAGGTRLFRLAQVPVAATQYVDTIPFWGDTPSNAMTPVEPPYLNHKPRPFAVGARTSNRFALRDETRKNRIWFTGGVEVRAQDPASSSVYEAVPGARNDALTDASNATEEIFVELPDESAEVRLMVWWEEALMVGTERGVVFVWGDKPANLRPSNTSTYSFGLFHRNAACKTHRGLVLFTEERKLVIDPAARESSADRSGYVIDIGWQIQPELDKADIQYPNRFQMAHYHFGSERDWLVVALTNQNVIDGGTAHLFVYDFNLGGWISFTDVAATCVSVVRESQGFHFLVAGNSGADRGLKVACDYNPSVSSPYAAAAARLGLPAAGSEVLPANTWKTALLSPGDPDLWKYWRKLAFYKKGGFDVTVNAWYDPADIDQLGAGEAIGFAQLESQEWEGWLQRHHKRAVFQFAVAAGGPAGALQGVVLHADPKSNVGV